MQTTLLAQRLPHPIQLARLEHLRGMRIAGEDVLGYLQGQLSNDVATLAPGHAQLTSFNNAQGRVLAVGRLVRPNSADQEYWLFVDRDIAEVVAQKLRMYILRARVTLALDDSLQAHALIGANAESALQANAGKIPTSHGALRINGEMSRIEIFADNSLAECFASLPVLEQDELSVLDILYRIPRLTTATQGTWVAQMLNLDELDGINFRKGCYTGQEIIARMHYLGKLKKRAEIVFARIDASPGDKVALPSGEEGELVSTLPEAGIALVVVRQ